MRYSRTTQRFFSPEAAFRRGIKAQTQAFGEGRFRANGIGQFNLRNDCSLVARPLLCALPDRSFACIADGERRLRRAPLRRQEESAKMKLRQKTFIAWSFA